MVEWLNAGADRSLDVMTSRIGTRVLHLLEDGHLVQLHAQPHARCQPNPTHPRLTVPSPPFSFIQVTPFVRT